jgi:DNA-binding CsgD family transcriptional regulator
MSILLGSSLCVSCGVGLSQQTVIAHFSGYSEELKAKKIHLIIDQPVLSAYLIPDGSFFDGKVIVFTTNLSPEYWEDLWEKGIDILIVEHGDISFALSAGINALRNGERYRHTPGTPLLLSARERKIASSIALGLEVGEVSIALGVSQQHVRNVLCKVNEKLNIKNQRQLSFYYTGQWHLLQHLGWVSPHR